jgi:hypothetical protein
MEQTKNLCAQIPIELHERVRAGQAQSGKTLSDYITQILTEYYNGGISMTIRTLAVQISEELFQRLKAHLAQESERTGRKITQKEFLLSLIEQALEAATEAETEAEAEP